MHVYFRMVNNFKAEGCDAPVPKGTKTLLQVIH